ncbi:hypothetical protein EB796_014986 [Bugula neritina]|uniref:Ephrin RBD domain-containing protein n=1 Tax=Bugula neritina TaxID=10212 RepID=A0A7J7JM69_BUGNE|nr:hypothetical protein EB796_014986 [Bugula neritina]
MYYFISTSDGSMSGIDNRSSEGSACKMHNMKMKLNISAPAGYQKSTRWQYTTRRPSEAGTRAGSLTHTTTLTDLSSKTTTDYARPKFPQAVINAEIKMYSSSSTPPCSPLMFVLSLLCCLLCRHHIP